MIVPKVLCGGADSGSAGGAQRCEPGEVKFHPSGEAQQDIPSYPLSRRCSFRRKGKHVDGFLAWEASNDRKLQLFTMKRKTLEILLEWKPQGLGSQEVRHLKREHPEQMHYIISELEVGIGAVCIAFDSEQLGVAWFVYSCTILYAMGTLPLTLQLTMSYQYVFFVTRSVQRKRNKWCLYLYIYMWTSPLLMVYRFFNNTPSAAICPSSFERQNSCSGRRTLNAIFKRSNGPTVEMGVSLQFCGLWQFPTPAAI